MRMLRKLLRDRKGITMTEVIVAMATVVLVTGAAISLLVASVRFDAKYDSQTRALNACESAVHCIRFTDDPAKLADYLGRLGFTLDGDTFTLSGGGTAVEVVKTDDGWRVTFDGETVYETN